MHKQSENARQAMLWDDQKRELFIENINYKEVARINSLLVIFLSLGNANINNIDMVVNNIKNLFAANSKAIFGIKKNRKKYHQIKVVTNHRLILNVAESEMSTIKPESSIIKTKQTTTKMH